MSNNKRPIEFLVRASPVIYYPGDLSPIFCVPAETVFSCLGQTTSHKRPWIQFPWKLCLCVSARLCVCVFNKMIETVSIAQRSALHQRKTRDTVFVVVGVE